MLKIALLLVKNMFFGLNEGISKKVAQAAPKHTADKFSILGKDGSSSAVVVLTNRTKISNITKGNIFQLNIT